MGGQGKKNKRKRSLNGGESKYSNFLSNGSYSQGSHI